MGDSVVDTVGAVVSFSVVGCSVGESVTDTVGTSVGSNVDGLAEG